MGEVSGSWFVDQEEPEHRRPRGHPSGDGAVRPDRRAVGSAGAVATYAVAVGSAVVVEQTAVDRRDPVAGAHRSAMAGHAGGIRVLGSGLWVVPALATRGCLAADSDCA